MAKQKILIADDEAQIRESCAYILRRKALRLLKPKTVLPQF